MEKRRGGHEESRSGSRPLMAQRWGQGPGPVRRWVEGWRRGSGSKKINQKS